ncbi:MAG: Na+/H+ antiporter subunit E, partial [Halobacteriales archaeon]
MRVRKWPVVGGLLAVLWLFVRGVELTPDAVLGELLIGLAVGLPVAYVARQLYLPEFDLGRSVRVLPRAVWYLGAFLWELLTANIDVAYRVLHPSLPIEPDV